MFISYDIKSIQRHIFSVPRLKTIIGASAQIWEFDRDARLRYPDECIFAGGGRGVFHFISRGEDQLGQVKGWLVKRAHRVGLDIEVGMAETFEAAALQNAAFYPYLPTPEELAGYPCAESGLLPVKSRNSAHSIIKARSLLGQRDLVGQELIDNHLRDRLPQDLQNRYLVTFLRNVSPEQFAPSDDTDEEIAKFEAGELDQAIAMAGQSSLGNRNRWAIIAIDGNDIGKQFRHCTSHFRQHSEQLSFLRTISEMLEQSLSEAFHQALSECIADWYRAENREIGGLDDCSYEDGSSHPKLVLPFRPLIRGGDDLVMICHCAHALDFVRKITEYFEENTRVLGLESGYAWPATGGRLTLSSGILFANTGLPLHTAIGYAESLMASAKGRYRNCGEAQQPTPAAVDWDTITDSMIDTPSARRRRELMFADDEIGRVVSLTRRPYLVFNGSGKTADAPSLSELDARLEQLRNGFPNSFRASLQRSLAGTWSSRMRFRFSIAKVERYRKLAEELDEEHFDDLRKLGRAWGQAWEAEPKPNSRPAQDTAILDAISILDEMHRADQTTANQEA